MKNRPKTLEIFGIRGERITAYTLESGFLITFPKKKGCHVVVWGDNDREKREFPSDKSKKI